MNEARLAQLEKLSDKLFCQIDQHIKKLSENVDNLKSRIEATKQIIDKITQDHNKATRFYSPAYYPHCEPIEIEPIRWSHRELFSAYGLGTSRSTLLGRIDDLHHVQKVNYPIIEQLNDLTESLKEKKKSGTNNLVGVTSVSSLLVHHTYESLLAPKRDSLLAQAANRSTSSGFSTQRDCGAKSFKSKHNPNKSSSGDEPPESNLGPVPGSILRYHQESMIEPDLIDAVDILDLQDDDDDDQSNLLSDDLPDILPSLTGIVRDVSQPAHTNPSPWVDEGIQRNQIQSTFDDTNAKVSQSYIPPSISAQLPPPPPPPMPSAPLHQVQPLNLSHSSEGAPPLQPPIPPPPPPLCLPLPTENDSIVDEPVAKPTVSGRDALMAEIRSAASKPKARPKVVSKTEEDESAQSKREQAKLASPTPTSNPRDSLLASIREAAGRPKLRKTIQIPRNRRLEEKIGQKRNDDSVAQGASIKGDKGGDLMSDLVNKLRARRDGISGSFVETKPNATSSAGNKLKPSEPKLDNTQHQVMNQLSSMIPVRQPSSSDGGDDGKRSDDDSEDLDWN